MPNVWLKRQIQHETEVVPHSHTPRFAADFKRKSNAKDPLHECEAGDHERPHLLALQVQRQLLHPPGRELLQSMGDQARAASEELVGLSNHLLARTSRLDQLSGSRQDGRCDPLFEPAGEQEPLNVPCRTQARDLCFSHSDHLMVESETRHRTSADSVGMSVCDGASAGDEPASIANLFGDEKSAGASRRQGMLPCGSPSYS